MRARQTPPTMRAAHAAHAAGELYVAIRRAGARGEGTCWAPGLGPLNTRERAAVRRFVADLITYEIAAPGPTAAERNLLSLSRR